MTEIFIIAQVRKGVDPVQPKFLIEAELAELIRSRLLTEYSIDTEDKGSELTTAPAIAQPVGRTPRYLQDQRIFRCSRDGHGAVVIVTDGAKGPAVVDCPICAYSITKSEVVKVMAIRDLMS